MLFLLEVELADAPALDAHELLELAVREWEALLEHERRKRFVAGGKLAGRRGAAAIFEVEDADELDRIVAALPLAPHFSRVCVTPLVGPQQALKDARRRLHLARGE